MMHFLGVSDGGALVTCLSPRGAHHFSWNSTSSSPSTRSCSIENSARAAPGSAHGMDPERLPVSRASASRRSLATTSSVA